MTLAILATLDFTKCRTAASLPHFLQAEVHIVMLLAMAFAVHARQEWQGRNDMVLKTNGAKTCHRQSEESACSYMVIVCQILVN